MSSKPALSIVDRDRSARGDSAPRASLTLPTRQNFAATSICFGAFCLWPVRRLLLQDNQPVRIGSRALDILIALLERPGDLVTKDELMARVWPNTFVEPANLTVHIAALRRALGDGRDGNRFLINIPGRGYRFVAPVTLSEHSKPSLPNRGRTWRNRQDRRRPYGRREDGRELPARHMVDRPGNG